MSDLETLIRRAQEVAHLPSREYALRWLRAVASILADWGGKPAAAILAMTLPAEILKGAGTSGRSLERALRAAGPEGERVVVHVEAGARVVEPDPGKVGVALRPLLGLVKSQLTPEQVEAVAAALPAPAAALFRGASTSAPWAFRLIPQSYARPERPPSGH